MHNGDFNNLESRLVDILENLQLFKLPIRTVLTSYYGIIDRLFHGSRFNDKQNARPKSAAALTSRLSYLTSSFLRCPLTPTGASAADAIAPMTPELYSELEYLISYGFFCEIAPQVQRGYYSVTSSKGVFILSHIDEEFRKAETRDIILGDLSSPFLITPPVSSAFFDKQVETLPVVDRANTLHYIRAFYQWYMKHIFECSVVTDDGLQKTFGVSLDEFRRFRASWMSVAQFNLEMAAAISRKAKQTNHSDKELLAIEFLEWQVPYLKEDFIRSVILFTSKLSIDQYNALMRIYCLDPIYKHAAGEGFFPPLLRLEDGLLFQPNVLQTMLCSRNIPYALNKIDQPLFSNALAPYLEPKLIDIADQIFRRLQNVQILKNVKWDRGEIDMLVYSSDENYAIHIQAKGAVPPEGARMVQNVQSRIEQGIYQLKVFRDITQQEKEFILEKALGKSVENVKIVDALLVWSTFGTKDVWLSLKDIAPLNVPVLFTLVDKYPNLTLHNFVSLAWRVIEEVVDITSPIWYEEKLRIGDENIRVPGLDYNKTSLFAYKKHLKVFN